MSNDQIKNNRVANSNVPNRTNKNANSSAALAQTQQKGQLDKDAAVHSRNKGLDSNRNYSSGLSQSSDNGAFKNNKVSGSNNIGKNNLDNHFKKGSSPSSQGASRIANTIQNIKSKRMNLIPKPSNQEINSSEEVEEAENAVSQGREYNEDNVGGNATFKLDKKTKIALAAFVFGAVGVFIFLGIIVMSAMTTTAGKIYLQAKYEKDEKITEEELSKTYDDQKVEEKDE